MRLSTVRLTAALVLAVLGLGLGACSSVRHVPQGQYLLDKVEIDITDRDDIERSELYNFLRQQPNHKVLGFARLQLATYSLSGSDSTKWYNRWLRRIGQAPVIYDRELTEASARQLRLALINSGYLDATVEADTLVRGPKRMEVDYSITAGEPHRIATLDYNISDPALRSLVMADTAGGFLHTGMLLNRTQLDNERGRIARLLRDNGYYDFNREYINFTADTIAGSKLTGVTLNLHNPGATQSHKSSLEATASALKGDGGAHRRYEIRKVEFVIEYNLDENSASAPHDTVEYRGTLFVYGKDRYLRPEVLDEMCYLTPGKTYSASDVERTYEALGRLSIIKFINIELTPAGDAGGTGLL
ncbi:MAG: outer membrane protein assembly factor, partial [Muribaculaceae bacterium]|nr:outer membrane protein assembly factor [Muribaculaceae bacterium]